MIKFKGGGTSILLEGHARSQSHCSYLSFMTGYITIYLVNKEQIKTNEKGKLELINLSLPQYALILTILEYFNNHMEMIDGIGN